MTFVDVILPRNEAAMTIRNVGQRAEPIMLQLENPIGMIECGRRTGGNGEADGREIPA
jgi:hypothetical protein